MQKTFFRLLFFSAIALFFVQAEPAFAQQKEGVTFQICSSAKRINCIVDGDTFWLNGHKIRIADIDAPETLHAKCSAERELGLKASQNLLQWMNTGSFLMKITNPSKDHYGRLLRIVLRSGKSAGDELIAKGLARRWTGSRASWCAQ